MGGMDLLARPEAGATAPRTAATGEAEPSRRRKSITRPWPLAAAVGAGLTLLLAFPPYDAWWLAPVGVALLGIATYGRGFWVGAGLGAVTGLSLLIPLLSWAGGFVGPVWLFLPFGESAYFALLGGLSAQIGRAHV